MQNILELVGLKNLSIKIDFYLVQNEEHEFKIKLCPCLFSCNIVKVFTQNRMLHDDL